jgi:hypothetical protein
MTKRLLVTGSRTWTNAATIEDALRGAFHELRDYGWERIVLVSGACPEGADAIAEHIWTYHHQQVERHPVEWRPYGIYNPEAGKARNKVMVDLGADLCLAFIHRNSSGATHCANLAEAAGIPVRRWITN